MKVPVNLLRVGMDESYLLNCREIDETVVSKQRE